MNLNDLNPMQRRAAETLDGPVLILAGAGSGKTRTITYRIANLIAHGVKPWQILALTFTNKAAKEMKSRVEKLAGADAEDMWIGTFHSVCCRVLRRDIEKLGYKRSFVIYDDDDQLKVIKESLKQLNIDEKELSPREIRAKISDAKNRLYTPDDWFERSDKGFRASRIHDVFRLYEQKLKLCDALDFDDLLLRTLQLFADHPPVLQYYAERFSYVHVDEYQDTNTAQYELVRMLTASSRNLCVVGDDDQSIYGWRGADIRNILDFEKDYPDAAVIRLEQNYRSTANILDAANQVIAHNAERKEKALWTDGEAGEKIRLFCGGDEWEEAAWIAQNIQENKNTVPYGDTAVLYRTHAQSRVIEELLMKSGIPYRVFGGTRFYDRAEIKNAVAYLRITVNPSDDVSLKRVINIPRRGIGDTTVQLISDEAGRENVPFFSVLSALPESVGPRAKKSISSFVSLLYSMIMKKATSTLSEFVEWMLNETGLIDEQMREDSDEARDRIGNLQELVSAAKEFENSSEEKTLEAFLENVSLVTDMDRENEAPQYVTLMTLHSAKGLEYGAVFIAGMEEGVFPSARCEQEPGRLEEERRLCYVGITRAKQRLYLSRAFRRMTYNQLSCNPPSVFLSEIPRRLLEEEGRKGGGFSGAFSRPGRGQDAFSSRPQSKWGVSSVFRGGNAGNAASAKPAVKDPLDIPGVTRGFSAPPASAAPTLFKPGDRVMHRKFGVGTVQSVSGRGADAKIVIAFQTAGVRTLALAIAPITKLET